VTSSTGGSPAARPPLEARDLVLAGRNHERRGDIPAAVESYAAAVDCAGPADAASLSEALRRLAVVHHLRAEPEAALELCSRAAAVATDAGLPLLAAEADNALGGFAFESGRIAEARQHYERALELAPSHPEFVAKVEHNLGILHNVRGEWAEARASYDRACASAESRGDDRGAALAYHNLGMLAADARLWDEAYRQFQRARAIAVREGDVHLEGLCLLNQADVHLALERWAEAREDAEAALRIFDGLDSRRDKSAGNRVLGVVFRETDRPALAESRLRSAVEIAVGAGCPLSEAESRRELGELYRRKGRLADALNQLDAAAAIFSRLGARSDVADLDQRLGRLRAA
jgi:tetratricopeptide (TPR) repeat protein